MMYRIIARDDGETMLLGEKLGLAVTFPCVIILTGDLGAGKTTFMRGLGRGMEVLEDISSPSFTLLNVHQGRMEVYHFDFYRLTGPEELWDLDLDEYFFGEGVSVVEWGDKFPSLLPPAYLEVNLALVPGHFAQRVVTFIPRGEYAETLVRELSNHAGFGD